MKHPVAAYSGIHIHKYVTMYNPMNPMASDQMCIYCGIWASKGK